MESMRPSFGKPKYKNLNTVTGGAPDIDAKFGQTVESHIPT